MLVELHRAVRRGLYDPVVNPERRFLLEQRFFGRHIFIHINKCGGTSVEKLLGIPVTIHDTAVQRRDKVGEARWNRSFKFTIVRHPYEKVKSHYWYRVMTNKTGLGDEHIDINDWVVRAYGKKDPSYYNNELMFAPCYDWISDESGNVIVDFVARLERIKEDWCYIQEKIGSKGDLPHVNSTSGIDKRQLDLSEESKLIIDAHFAVDFENFGYSQ